MHVSLLTVVALAANSLAFPTTGTGIDKRSFAKTRVFESINSAPSRWAKQDAATLTKDESTLDLRIQLAHQNMDKFHELALNVWSRPSQYAP